MNKNNVINELNYLIGASYDEIDNQLEKLGVDVENETFKTEFLNYNTEINALSNNQKNKETQEEKENTVKLNYYLTAVDIGSRDIAKLCLNLFSKQVYENSEIVAQHMITNKDKSNVDINDDFVRGALSFSNLKVFAELFKKLDVHNTEQSAIISSDDLLETLNEFLKNTVAEKKNKDKSPIVSGGTMTHLAAERGMKEIFDLLYKNHAPLNVIWGKYGSETLLDAAIKGGNTEIINTLLQDKKYMKDVLKPWLKNLKSKYSKDTKYQFPQSPILTAYDNYATHDVYYRLIDELFDFAKSSDEKEIILNGSERVTPPLHIAVQNDDRKLFDSLINKGATVEAKNSKGETPLHIAAQNANTTFFNLLVQKGAKLDVKDKSGKTFIDHALSVEQYANHEVTQALLSAYPARSEFLYAVIEVMKSMKVDKEKYVTPLCQVLEALLSESQDTKCVKSLVTYLSGMPMLKTTHIPAVVREPLAYAAKLDNVDMCNVILNSVDCTEQDREQAFEFSLSDGRNGKLLELFVKSGKFSGLTSKYHDKVLLAAVENSNKYLFNKYINGIQVFTDKQVGALLEMASVKASDVNPVSVEIYNKVRRKAMHNFKAVDVCEAFDGTDKNKGLALILLCDAVKGGDENCVKWLLERPSNDIFGGNILQAAYSNLSLLQQEWSGNVSDLEVEGLPLLTYALTNGKTKIATLLVDKFPGLLKGTNTRGTTVLDALLVKGNKAATKWLIDHGFSKPQALTLAVKHSKTDIVRLLTKGKKGELKISELKISVPEVLISIEDQSLLTHALEKCDLKIATLLIDADPSIVTNLSEAEISNLPLDRIMSSGEENFFKFLAKRDFPVETLLNLAVKHRKTNLVKSLIQGSKGELDMLKLNIGSETLLTYTLREGYKNIPMLLIKEVSGLNNFSGEDGKGPVDLVLESKNKTLLKLLLNNGVEGGAASKALAFAFQENDADLVKLIVDKGGDVNSALTLAVEHRKTDLVKWLSKKGGVEISDLKIDDQSLLTHALKNSDTNIATLLINADPSVVKTISDINVEQSSVEDSSIPFDVIIGKDKAKCAKLLVKKGFPVEKVLPFAVKNRDTNFVRWLVDHDKSAVQKVGKRVIEGKGVLDYALKKGDINIATLLIHADPNMVNSISDINADESAISFGDIMGQGDGKFARFLVDKGFNPNEALTLAVENSDTNLAKWLIKRGTNDLNVEAVKINDEPLLFHLLKVGNTKMVELLVNKYPTQIINQKSSDGISLFESVMQQGKTELARLFVEQGFDANQALTFAVKNRDANFVQWLTKQSGELSVANNLPIVDGETLLTLAVSNGDTKIVESLLNKYSEGIEGVKNQDGATPLHIAVSKGNTKLVKLLLQQKNVGLDKMDQHGKTALHIAIERADNEIAKLLISEGADLNIKDGGDKTPLLLAVKGKNKTVIELLIDKGEKLDIAPLEYALNEYSHVLSDTPARRAILSNVIKPLLKNPNLYTAEHFAKLLHTQVSSFETDGYELGSVFLEKAIQYKELPLEDAKKYIEKLYSGVLPTRGGNKKLLPLVLKYAATLGEESVYRQGDFQTKVLSSAIELRDIAVFKHHIKYLDTKEGVMSLLVLTNKLLLDPHTPQNDYDLLLYIYDSIVRKCTSEFVVTDMNYANLRLLVSVIKDRGDKDLLKWFIKEGTVETLDALSDPMWADFENEEVHTLLTDALKKGNTEVAELLIRAGSAKLNNERNGQQQSPLGMVLQNNRNTKLAMLLVDNGVDKEEALIAAIRNCNLKVFKLLVNKKYKTVKNELTDNQKVINAIKIHANPLFVKFLVSEGVSAEKLLKGMLTQGEGTLTLTQLKDGEHVSSKSMKWLCNKIGDTRVKELCAEVQAVERTNDITLFEEAESTHHANSIDEDNMVLSAGNVASDCIEENTALFDEALEARRRDSNVDGSLLQHVMDQADELHLDSLQLSQDTDNSVESSRNFADTITRNGSYKDKEGHSGSKSNSNTDKDGGMGQGI